MHAISLGYHDVSGGGQPPDAARGASVYTIPYEAFVDQLRRVGARTAARQVSLINRRSDWGASVPVFLTFDDGALCAHSCVAAELEKAGWSGHFFITTDWIGRPGFLDQRRIRQLHDRGHVIGSHSCRHPERMSCMNPDELLREWSDSCRVLSDIVGQPVRTASVAGGYYSCRVGRAAAAAGIEVLFTSEPATAVTMEDGCMVLGRYSIRRSTPASVVAAIAAGEKWPRYEQAVLWSAKSVVKRVAGRWYLDVRRMALARGLSS